MATSGEPASAVPSPKPTLLDPIIWNDRAFDGDWITLSGSADAVEPATGSKLGAFSLASEPDVAVAANSAREAQKHWAAMPYGDRAKVFREAARIAEKHSKEMADWIVRESGSVRSKADFEIEASIKVLHEAAAMPSQATGQVLPSDGIRLSFARRRPMGVVGVIAPFNFPLYLAIRAVAPALAVGNAVVLKPDVRTTICGGFSIARIFEQAGLPKGLLHIIPGAGEIGAALCADPNVAMIQFTGSTGAGRKVGETAGRHLKKVSLELGGKNSIIVLDDADLDLAVKSTRWSTYLHQGQICMAAGRVLVQSSIVDEFTKRLSESARITPVGDPSAGGVALGPLIDETQTNHATRIVEETVAAGAHLAAGGRPDGLFFPATVLSGVSRTMPAFTEEMFAPVAVVVPFETDADAIELSNDTEYGLSAAVITKSISRALAISDRLRVGLIHVNDATVNDDVVNPFGGVGSSGNGTSIGGPANWEEFTQWQWMTMRGEPPAYPL